MLVKRQNFNLLGGQMKIVFRCDASAQIGAGHVMRCLTVADELASQGFSSVFLCSEETINDFSSLFEGAHQVIPSDTSGVTADVLIIDHYDLDIDYERGARAWAKRIVVIDDLVNRRHDCDLLLDQTLERQAEDYEHLIPEHCKVLAGTSYALLRSQFTALRSKALQKRKESQAHIQRLMISLGNTNLHNITGTVLHALSKTNGVSFDIDVILGGKALFLDDVKKIIKSLNENGTHKVSLDLDVKNMAQRMLEADLSIGAPGTTSWERCALGLPALLVQLADNQKDNVVALSNAGAAINLGSHDDLSETHIIEALNMLVSDQDKLSSMSEACLDICDGLGAQRFVGSIKELFQPNITLRKVDMNDAEALLEWRNDSKARSVSLNSEIIDIEEHKSWLTGVLADANRDLCIALYNGVPVGTVRSDYDGEFYELSWNIAPQYRGYGFARLMIEEAMNQSSGPFRALIKKDNNASIHIAKSIGMVLQKEQDDVLFYHKNKGSA